MQAALGIIEGFYGKPWSWQARAETVAFLAPHGYRFYCYAPKSDLFLRERWREDHPREEAEHLRMFAARCRELGVRFGIGLSPFEIYRDFDRDARAALARKQAFLADIGIDDLAILFDDMKGDVPDLAEKQVEIVHWIAERMTAKNLIVCPTYYSDDPVLDRVFGQRPENYLEEFGARLDPGIDIFWTGEEVCARAFTSGHLERICNLIGRKPVLWDNYPVNDGKRMSQYLHLRAFTGRPAADRRIYLRACHQPGAATGTVAHTGTDTCRELCAVATLMNTAALFQTRRSMVAGDRLGDMLRAGHSASAGYVDWTGWKRQRSACANAMAISTIRQRERSLRGSTAPTGIEARAPTS